MYKFLLSTRYLRTRFIALASIISVMLGVATMIVVNSVMAGFSVEMKDRLHGVLADVIISTVSMNGVADAEKWTDWVEKVGGDQIAGMTTSVEVYGMMTFKYGTESVTRPITLVGIEPRGKATVGPLKEYLASYQDGLRDADAPPSWELTEEARKYRENWVFRGSWEETDYPEWPELDDQSASLPPSPEETPDFAEGSDEKENTPPNESPAFKEGTSPAVTPPEGEIQNPFLAQDSEPQEEIDPAEPHRGRAYIGHGLISYPVTDPKTGKVTDRLMVRPGDDVQLSTVNTARPPAPVSMGVTVVDVLKTGMSEYDSNLVYCNLDYLQEVRGMVHPGTNVRDFTTIQIRLKDYSQAPEIVRQLKAAFPPDMFMVQTWEDKQGPLLAAVEMESAILNVLLFLIIAVAGFGILAIFFMIVVEKTRDIGIMKALGASASGIMSIFLSYGLALGLVGSGVGVAMGLLFVRYINEIESGLSWLTGRPVFNEEIYYFSEIPTMVSPWMVFWVALGAITIAVLASILPARRAAKLHPVQSLRYE